MMRMKIYAVQIRFALSGMKNAIPADELDCYIDGLIDHIRAEDNGIPDTKKPDYSKPMPFLVIEDKNTIGLEGQSRRV